MKLGAPDLRGGLAHATDAVSVRLLAVRSFTPHDASANLIIASPVEAVQAVNLTFNVGCLDDAKPISSFMSRLQYPPEI